MRILHLFHFLLLIQRNPLLLIISDLRSVSLLLVGNSLFVIVIVTQSSLLLLNISDLRSVSLLLVGNSLLPKLSPQLESEHCKQTTLYPTLLHL